MGKKRQKLPDGTQIVIVEKKGMGGCGLIFCIVAALFIFFVVLPMGGCTAIMGALGFAVNEAAKDAQEGDESAKVENVPSDLLPGIRVFLDQHEEFGNPSGTQTISDWAQGKRQWVQFNTGRNLLFYLKGGKVVTVYEDDPELGRKKVWGE